MNFRKSNFWTSHYKEVVKRHLWVKFRNFYCKDGRENNYWKLEIFEKRRISLHACCPTYGSASISAIWRLIEKCSMRLLHHFGSPKRWNTFWGSLAPNVKFTTEGGQNYKFWKCLLWIFENQISELAIWQKWSGDIYGLKFGIFIPKVVQKRICENCTFSENVVLAYA